MTETEFRKVRSTSLGKKLSEKEVFSLIDDILRLDICTAFFQEKADSGWDFEEMEEFYWTVMIIEKLKIFPPFPNILIECSLTREMTTEDILLSIQDVFNCSENEFLKNNPGPSTQKDIDFYRAVKMLEKDILGSVTS